MHFGPVAQEVVSRIHSGLVAQEMASKIHFGPMVALLRINKVLTAGLGIKVVVHR